MAWTNPRTWNTGELVTASLLNTHLRDNLNYLYQEVALPQFIDINVWLRPYSNVGFNLLANNTNYYGYTVRYSSGAQNDSITWYLPLQAGVWNVEIVHVRDLSVGIYSVRLNAEEIGTFDGYSPTVVYSVRNEFTNIVVPNTAIYQFSIQMTAKNVASSSYLGVLNGIRWWRNP